MRSDDQNVDLVTTEIIRNAFISIVIRSAYSPVIYEGKDCSVALLDDMGDVLGQSMGLPLFLGNLEICVKLTAEMFGWDVFQPGDIFFMNDSYMAGTHLNDATIFSPIYWQGKRVGFAATRAHWRDVGAKDPGSPMDSHEIYQEGMRFAPIRIFAGGQPREDVIDIIRRNSRFGQNIVGDMNAQVAACRTGERRFMAIMDRFGYETLYAARDEIFRQSELLEREAVSAIPDGIYSAEGCLDNDGLSEEPVPVKVKIEVAGDSMRVDLSGSSPQTRGAVNCGFAQTVSAVRVGFKLLVNPNRPVDGGTFKTLTISRPEKTLFDAQEPAACQWYFSGLGLLIDLIPKALAPALPNKVAGAHYGDSMVMAVSGTDPRKDNIRFLAGAPTTGGWGAFATNDGQDSLINNVNGGFKDIPVEVLENKYPIMLTGYHFRVDSGGPGRFRGGTGTIRELKLETDASFYLWFERSVTPGWGLFGGTDGVGPRVTFNPGQEDERQMLKVNALPLSDGSVVRLESGGGGGFGPPWERDPERVRIDVIDRYVSREGAARDYGVILRDDLSIDGAKTAVRRQAMETTSL
jgi:N-methylhydantoinase B